MQRIGRTMVVVGTLATLGIVATGILGFLGFGEGEDARAHILVGLGAILLFLLAHLWILFYLFGAVRVLGRTAGEAGMPLDGELARFRSHTLPPLVLVVALAVSCFVLGVAAYSAGGPVTTHATAFYLLLPAQAWAAWREWRTFGAAERMIRGLQVA